MSEITYSSIYDGVSLALHEAFPNAQIHGGQVKQGLKPGDLNVLITAASHDLQITRRYRRDLAVDVIYYPKSSPCESECMGMAHQLAFVLETVKTPGGDLVHAQDCSWDVIDDVLHMQLSYQFHGITPYDEAVMDAAFDHSVALEGTEVKNE